MYAPMRAAAPREGDDREFPAVDIANAARRGLKLRKLSAFTKMIAGRGESKFRTMTHNLFSDMHAKRADNEQNNEVVKKIEDKQKKQDRVPKFFELGLLPPSKHPVVKEDEKEEDVQEAEHEHST